uniref:Elongation of fatty acids protein n=1 Tax=Vannella robusta TaxID=1487602 RepID=A0A7S4IAG7_9EUKA
MVTAPWLNAHRLFINDSTTIFELIDTWWKDWGTLYVVVGVLYLPTIFTLQYLWRNQNPINIKYIRVLHNIFFCLFSALGAIELTPTMINTWKAADYSFHNTVCDGYFHYQVESFWVFAFVISKLFELLESLYFIVEKKPLSFLHWYHHFATYTFSCHALLMYNPSALYFAWMNLIVHAVMYLYYTLATITGKPPSWGIIVTIGQIIQMFIGVAVTYEVFNCRVLYDSINAWFGLLMYISYVFLFVRFFVLRYVLRGRRRSSKDTKKE